MSDRRRNLFMIGLFISISLTLFFFGRFLSVDDLNADQNYLKITRTAADVHNPTTVGQAAVTLTPTPIVLNLLTERFDPLDTAVAEALTRTQEASIKSTFTPIPYTADMSPTALPLPSYTPTLCPPSDIICAGGNATASAGQQVLILMASASAPEFGQLAQTATALAVLPIPTPTSGVSNTPCAFMWAHQDLPEIAKAAQEELIAADTKIEVLRADAYGESCGTNFGAMTTDFYLSANVINLNDNNELAQVVVTAYKTLIALKVKLPAALGYLDIQFTADGATKHFRATFPTIKSALDSGKGGESLLEIGDLR